MRRFDGYQRIMAVSILLAGTVLLLADLGALDVAALGLLLPVDLVMDFLERTAMVVLLGLNLGSGVAGKRDGCQADGGYWLTDFRVTLARWGERRVRALEEGAGQDMGLGYAHGGDHAAGRRGRVPGGAGWRSLDWLLCRGGLDDGLFGDCHDDHLVAVVVASDTWDRSKLRAKVGWGWCNFL